MIPEEWEITNVRGIASTARNSIVGGPFGSDLVSADYVDDGVPVIRGTNMSEQWISGAFVFVTPRKAKTLESNLARPGDIVFTSDDQQDLVRGGTIQTGVPHINLGILRDILFEITSSKRVFQSEWKSEGIPFYRARELAVLGETGRVDNDLFIAKSLYDSFRTAHGVPEVGDMLVTGVGTLGKVYVVRDEAEFYFKDGNIIRFKIRGAVSAEFLRQLYLTKVVMKQITDGSAGTTVGTYTISGAKKTEILFPPLPEQTAIATVLSDMDAELAALEQRRDKTRALKQGMMQELLTGRTRLPGNASPGNAKPQLGE